MPARTARRSGCSSVDETYYREELLAHYRDPQNRRDLPGANAVASHANTSCGDRIVVMLKVEAGVIEDVAFQGTGCAISMAFASKLTEDLKGRKVEEVHRLDPSYALSFFPGQITPARVKCALLAFATAKDAIALYKKKGGS